MHSKGYRISKTNYVRSLLVDFGLQYTVYSDDWNYTLGLIYGNSTNLKNTADYYLNYMNDTIDLKGQSGDFIIPSKYGIGLGIAKAESSG